MVQLWLMVDHGHFVMVDMEEPLGTHKFSGWFVTIIKLLDDWRYPQLLRNNHMTWNDVVTSGWWFAFHTLLQL